MTARDRTVLIVLAVVAACGGFWFVAVKPKTKTAGDLQAQLKQAHQALADAQTQATSAAEAKRTYDHDYTTVARLGKAVPADDDMASLMYQIAAVSSHEGVDFHSIKLNSTGPTATAAPVTPAQAIGQTPTSSGSPSTPSSGSSPTTSSSATPSGTGAQPATAAQALPPGATVGPAGFPTLPFQFEFRGQFFGMERFLRSIDNLTQLQKGGISVKGRLFTVDGIQIKADPVKGFPRVDATISATAYVVPADEGLTAGATPLGPVGVQPASTSGSAAPTAAASFHGSVK